MSPRRRFASRPDPASPYRPPRRAPLPAGQLRDLVLAHLRAYAHLDFSPAEIANVLGRPQSRGAIINICKRLTDQGLVVRTRQRPARYRAADIPQDTGQQPAST